METGGVIHKNVVLDVINERTASALREFGGTAFCSRYLQAR